jgi:hypothetical protein
VRGVALRTIRVGNQPVTTRAWLEDFFESLAAVQRGEHTPMVRTPARRERDLEQAKSRLMEAGIA